MAGAARSGRTVAVASELESISMIGRGTANDSPPPVVSSGVQTASKQSSDQLSRAACCFLVLKLAAFLFAVFITGWLLGSMPFVTQMPQHPTWEWESNSSDSCERQASWLASAKGKIAPSKQILAGYNCHEVTNVCFRDSAIVHVGNGNEPPDLYWHPPSPTEPEELNWFWRANIVFSLPFYHDSGGKWVTQRDRPIRVRIVANDLEEDLQNAVFEDITPLVMFSNSPFNIGESFWRTIYTWSQFAFRNPAAQNFPIAIVTPFELPMPLFWRLLEPLAPSIESFGTLGRMCASKPLCFRRVVGCKIEEPFAIDVRKRQQDLITLFGISNFTQDWNRIVERIVSFHCGAAAIESRPRPGLVVAFAQREWDYRRVLNLDAMLEECATAWIDGIDVVCRRVHLKNALEDICMLQEIDVLISIHGAQIVNAMYMRPGTSVIEIKPNGWWGLDKEGRFDKEGRNFWGNLYNHVLWYTNSTFYWWYGVGEEMTSRGLHSKLARDDDVRLSWPVLRCMLTQIRTVRGNRTKYERLPRFGNFVTCEPLP